MPALGLPEEPADGHAGKGQKGECGGGDESEAEGAGFGDGFRFPEKIRIDVRAEFGDDLFQIKLGGFDILGCIERIGDDPDEFVGRNGRGIVDHSLGGFEAASEAEDAGIGLEDEDEAAAIREPGLLEAGGEIGRICGKEGALQNEVKPETVVMLEFRKTPGDATGHGGVAGEDAVFIQEAIDRGLGEADSREMLGGENRDEREADKDDEINETHRAQP